MPIILDRAYTGLPKGVCLNSMQELVNPYKDTDTNIIVGAPTASGKTVLINMLGKKHLDNKRAILYIATMKALAEEKWRDWDEKGHPWATLKKCIVTGDYVFTDEKLKELKEAQVIVMTPESLCSKLRNTNSKEWVPHIGLFVVDELHLVGQLGRGGNLEAAIIEFMIEAVKVQFLGLSATIPNIEDFRKWITYVGDKEAVAIVSDYRPIKLNIHYVLHAPGKSTTTERDRRERAIRIVNERTDQQYLVFVFKKTFGYSIMYSLREAGHDTDFHHAGKHKSERASIERRFMDGEIRVLISTITLATGVNLPARNVVITSDHAGGEPLPVPDLQQAAGRAGRPKYDTEGDVYYFVPDDKDRDSRILAIKNGEIILSTLNDIKHLAAHFLGALYLKRFDTEVNFLDWYKRTLAYVQNAYTSEEVAKIITGRVLEDMTKRGMIYKDASGKLSLTNRGKITAQYLMDPYYAHQLIMNLRKMFSLSSMDDQDLACAFGAVDRFYSFVPVYELQKYPSKIKKLGNYARGAYVYYLRVKGYEVPSELAAMNFTIYDDIDRTVQALVRYDAEGEKWKREDFLRNACVRIKHCCSAKEADFKVRNLTKADIKKLAQFGLQTFDEVMKNPSIAKKALSKKRIEDLKI